MPDLRLERVFPVSAQTLFDYVSTPQGLLQWWGPEGLHVPDHDLDFSRLGPWYSVMVNAEGQRFKVSGQVTLYDPPHAVGFTWGWHDDTDTRGAESHVTLRVEETEAGARLILDHRELPDTPEGARHNEGWTSSLRKLEAIFTSNI